MARVGPQGHKKEKGTQREVRLIIGSKGLALLCNEIQELCKKMQAVMVLLFMIPIVREFILQ